MKFIDLTIPFGIGTPAWPTYEPLQVKYFKRLAPNGANGQVVTHSNHVGTHLDGEIHFYTPGKDIASLDFDFLCRRSGHRRPQRCLRRLRHLHPGDDRGARRSARGGYPHHSHRLPSLWLGPTLSATKCATWSCTLVRMPALPNGVSPRSSDGSALTAAAPIIP